MYKTPPGRGGGGGEGGLLPAQGLFGSLLIKPCKFIIKAQVCMMRLGRHSKFVILMKNFNTHLCFSKADCGNNINFIQQFKFKMFDEG